jgi:hypothetical protein
MSKWDDWYHNQNEATQAWIDSQSKEDNKLIGMGIFVGFMLGMLVTILMML